MHIYSNLACMYVCKNLFLVQKMVIFNFCIKRVRKLMDVIYIWQAGSSEWLQMNHLWGANWCIIGGPLQGPFSVKLTTLSTGRSLSARDVIPRNWSPKGIYTSRLNFFTMQQKSTNHSKNS